MYVVRYFRLGNPSPTKIPGLLCAGLKIKIVIVEGPGYEDRIVVGLGSRSQAVNSNGVVRRSRSPPNILHSVLFLTVIVAYLRATLHRLPFRHLPLLLVFHPEVASRATLTNPFLPSTAYT